jgi:hypothetical protein
MCEYLSTQSEIASLRESLEKCQSFDEVIPAFKQHLDQDFLLRFLRENINHISQDSDFISPHIMAQFMFKVINTDDFDYTIRIFHEGQQKSSFIKWVQAGQVIKVTGKGALSVAFYALPENTLANEFDSSTQLKLIRRETYKSGDLITIDNCGIFGEIEAIDGTIVLQILNCKNMPGSDLCWSFSRASLESAFCESAKPAPSRLQNIIRLATAAGQRIPYETLNQLLSHRNALVRAETLTGITKFYPHLALTHLKDGLLDPSAMVSQHALNLFHAGLSNPLAEEVT